MPVHASIPIVSQKIEGSSLASMSNPDYLLSYKELLYSNGNIVEINVYSDSSKVFRLFSRAIGYNSGNVVSITTIDEITTRKMIKTIMYSADNSIESIITIIT